MTVVALAQTEALYRNSATHHSSDILHRRRQHLTLDCLPVVITYLVSTTYLYYGALYTRYWFEMFA